MVHKHSLGIYRNTDTTTDMNAAGTIVPFATTTRQDSDFTISANRVTVNFTGWVRVYCHLHLANPSVARVVTGIQFFLNAIAHGAISCGGYNRDVIATEESSTNLNEIIQVTSGDIIDVRTSIHGTAGTQAMSISGTSVLTLERIE